jgi:hypothetical protein
MLVSVVTVADIRGKIEKRVTKLYKDKNVGRRGKILWK